jgi:hypothetical protein
MAARAPRDPVVVPLATVGAIISQHSGREGREAKKIDQMIDSD